MHTLITAAKKIKKIGEKKEEEKNINSITTFFTAPALFVLNYLVIPK